MKRSIALATSCMLLWGCQKDNYEDPTIQQKIGQADVTNVVSSCAGYSGTCITNPYPCCTNGNCTWWAHKEASCNWGGAVLPSGSWGNAKQWAGTAMLNGYVVSSTPVSNSIACSSTLSSDGHVAYTTGVNTTNNTITVTEMGCSSIVGVRTKTYSLASFNQGFIHPIKLTCSSATISPNALVQYNPVSITAAIKIEGLGSYDGQFAAALHDLNGNFLGDIEVKSATSYSASTTPYQVTFSKSAISSAPGNYKLYIKFKPTNGNWYVLPNGIFSVVVSGCSSAAPTGITHSNVTGTGAKISWTQVTAQNIALEYKLSTASAWTTILLPGNYFYTNLSSLQKSKTYNYRLRKACSTNSYSSYSTTKSFTTLAY